MIPPSLHQELDTLGWRLAAGTLAYGGYQDALACILRRTFHCSAASLSSIADLPRAPADPLPAGGAATAAHFGQPLAMLTHRATTEAGNPAAAGLPPARPGDSGAFLDAIVAVNGQPVAILRCGPCTAPRRWTVDEETALKRLGARVALHLARRTAARPLTWRDGRGGDPTG
jgi:hypothetical protein